MLDKRPKKAVFTKFEQIRKLMCTTLDFKKVQVYRPKWEILKEDNLNYYIPYSTIAKRYMQLKKLVREINKSIDFIEDRFEYDDDFKKEVDKLKEEGKINKRNIRVFLEKEIEHILGENKDENKDKGDRKE